MPSGNASEERLKRQRAKLGGGGKGKDTESSGSGLSRGWLRRAFAADSANAPSAANREGKSGQLGPGRVAGADRMADNKAAKRASAAMGHTPKPDATKGKTASAATPPKPPTPSAAKPASPSAKAKSPAKAKRSGPSTAELNAKTNADTAELGRQTVERRKDREAAAGRAAARGPKTAAGSSAVNGSNGTVKVGSKSSFTRSDATGSTTGERVRSTRYSAMDRNN